MFDRLVAHWPPTFARRMALLLVAAMAFAGMLAAPSAALATPDATPKTDIVRAIRLVSEIRPSHFARGQQRVVLAAGTAAVRLLHRGHTACGALAGADRLLSLLELPTTWAHHHVPVKVVKAPVGLLRAAEKQLIRQAGARCAAPMKMTKVIRPLHGGRGFKPLPPPTEEAEQGTEPRIPVGHFRPLKVIGKPSAFGSGPFQGSTGGGSPAERSRAGTARGPAGPGQLAFFRFADVGNPGWSGVQEPTAAIGGNVVWYTGNPSVALSTNAGRTFRMLNPWTFLPDSGLPFCCDQVVSYSPQYNIFVWVMQYWCAAGTSNPANNDCRAAGTGANRVRIAVASPQALIADAANPGAAWTYWDITPQLFGQPATAWFDRSDLSVNIWNANWTVDIIRGHPGTGILLARISLQQLASRGTITVGYITDGPRMAPAEGPQTTTYFVGAESFSQEKIWSWAPFSGTLFRHDINHTTVPIYNAAMTGTDNGDWYDRYGIFPGEVESATVSGNTLYAAQGTGRSYCVANCSDPNQPPTLRQVFTHPAVFISKYDVNRWNEVGERWLWNPTIGAGFPALQTDGAGDVGIVFRAAPSGQNPQPIAGLLTLSEQFVLALPAGLPYEAGDYYSLRPGRTPHSFVMTAQTVQDDNGTINMHWQYIEYGTGQPPFELPPTVRVISPKNGALLTQGTGVTYRATVTDPLDGTLPSAAIVWREDGTEIGTGTTITNTEKVLGVHKVTVTATNAEGKSATASIKIEVVGAPPGPINVNITSPADGSIFTVQNQVPDNNGNFVITRQIT